MKQPVKIPLVTQPISVSQSLSRARRNVLSILPEIATRQPMVSGKTGIRWHMVMDPEALKRVLRDRLEDYPKSGVTKSLLRPAIGNSLFIAEGAQWHWQRRATAPAFSHRNVSALAPTMTRAAEATCARLKSGETHYFNMFEEMVSTTFQVISDVTLSGDSGLDRNLVHQAIDDYIVAAGRVTVADIFGLPSWFPRGGWLKSRRALAKMRAIADATIEARRVAPPNETPDLLDLLLGASDPETGRSLNTAELRDNLLTFIVAGHETTALTLSWALYLCGFDQEVQTRARTEAIAVLGNRAATQEDLAALPYTRAIIEETLRLYPPAAMVSRTAQQPDSLCGRQVNPKDTVILPIYALHRSHLHWEDPDSFKPERFLGGKIERYIYLPFGDGPRVCIGQSFAMQEATIILASLLARFKFTPVEGKTPKPVMILTLRPEGGVWLTADPI
ncbi:MAG: cytochrome P450 [Paracoccaceae bacterium]|nr:cytochrome P450 [Paracoccaceae bacterium]MDG1737325.1 cytochrome P450 [Paracoccaceae bacterium]MDG2257753.1 cytochrome P450 [Paracoccaceae bacterium]